jgi:hypothetical protein
MSLAALAAIVLSGLSGCDSDRICQPSNCEDVGGQHAPVITVNAPNGGESVFENVTVSWTATDPDSGEAVLLRITIEYSGNGGDTWVELASDEPNDGSYLWVVSELDDGSNYVVRAKATDPGGLYASDESDAPFAVSNSIVIVDRTGKRWDITHAVRKYGMHAGGWNYGLGPNAIRPIVNPHFHEPGDPGYPDAGNQIEVLGITIDGDSRAYPVWVLSSHEVVNDVVGGRHVAATY